jgi:hypothetical protein
VFNNPTIQINGSNLVAVSKSDLEACINKNTNICYSKGVKYVMTDNLMASIKAALQLCKSGAASASVVAAV